MKYQSEIIKEIIDTRGHEKSSLHYESECIESWIDENKGSYPKLCDYQSEWLNYINEKPIGEFPYETVTDITEATINNVVPYGYKSAILKGKTKYQIGEFVQDVLAYVQQFKTGYYLKIDDGTLCEGKNNHKYCEDYIPIPTGVSSITSIGSSQWKKLCCYDSNKKFICGSESSSELINLALNIPSNAKYFRYSTNTSRGENEYINIVSDNGLLLASSNYNIPCELVSVKMPVLTTTGKNLVNESKRVGGYIQAEVYLDGNINNFTTYLIECEPNTNYICTSVGGNRNAIATFENIPVNGTKALRVTFSNKITTTTDEKYLLYYVGTGSSATNIQIEIGSTPTTYEPYKSNILTVNEPIELRGIGDVQDTLDCLTGDVTQRIGEVVLNGSESWSVLKESNNTITFRIPFANFPNYNKMLCSVLKTQNPYLNPDDEGIWHNDSNQLQLTLLKTKVSNVDSLKTYLAENNITFHHQLAESVIKTVDLTVVNQDGENVSLRPIEGTMHLTTSSDTIKPLFSSEIPVEAITQNLASFIEE